MKAASVEARKRADGLLAEREDQLAALGERKKHVQAQVDKYKDLLATLSAQQRALFLAAASPVASTAQVSTARTKLTSVAEHQGHAGSCAQGRRVRARAGRQALRVGLRRTEQLRLFRSDDGLVRVGRHLAAALELPAVQLRPARLLRGDAPGDLVFLYSPISHVEIYIGDGLAVSAPTEGEDVKVVPVGNDFTGATRLVG